MKLNKRIKEIFDKMICLEIPIEQRREYIERIFMCGFKFKLGYHYQTLNDELDECIEKEVCSKDAVKRIDSAFDAINKYSERYYHHSHFDHPHHTF